MKRGPLAPIRRILSRITVAPIVLVILLASLVVHIWEWMWYTEGELEYDTSLPCAFQQFVHTCMFCPPRGGDADA